MHRSLIVHRTVAGGLFAALSCLAQTGSAPEQPRAFEVASVKVNRTGSTSTSMRTAHGRLTATNVSPLVLIRKGFGVQDFQISGGPAWLSTDRYDVSAKTSDAAAKVVKDEELWSFLQPMLVDRFRLKFHRETKQLPVYALVVVKTKMLTPNTSGETPMLRMRINGTKAGLEARNVPLSRLAESLSEYTTRKILDRTDLGGGFDFKLEWARDVSGEGMMDTMREDLGMTGPSLFTALKEQLGLQLKPAKGPVETIVIDGAERPSAN